jgi:PilZ domain
MTSAEQRRSRRKNPESTVQVVNAMTGHSMGRVGNLSIDGMMLIATTPTREDALYQFVFHLPDGRGQPVPIEVGVHEQWSEPAAAPGQYWSGFRIIDIAPHDFEVLKSWVHQQQNA